jgi:site-specific recombinase XerD
LLVPAYERQPDYAVVGLPEGDPLSRGGFEHVFDGWMVTELDIDARLGTHLHAHKLRATFATYFARSGGHLLTLQQLMGHADANTTNYYVQTDDEQKRKEIKQLRFTRD